MRKKLIMLLTLVFVALCCQYACTYAAMKCNNCGNIDITITYNTTSTTHTSILLCKKCNSVVQSVATSAHTWNNLHTCTVCGYREPHKYQAKITKNATCSNEGERTYTCICGASFTEKIDVLDHSFKYMGDTPEAQRHLLKCANCTATRKETHNFNSDNVCKVCAYKAGCTHTWKNATCTSPKTCTKCGETSGTALGHNYVYDDDGYGKDTHTLRCENCSATKSENHNLNSSGICKVCGYKTVCDHEYVYTSVNSTKHSLKCRKCSNTYEENHSFNSNDKCTKCGYKRNCTHTWKNATCTSPKTCTKCGETSGTALGHNYVYDDDGYGKDTHTLRCENCSATKSENHNLNSSGICKVCGYKTVCDHEYVYTSVNSTKHSLKCRKCSNTYEENHSFNSNDKCTKCGYKRNCTHTWKNATCTSPKTCTKCGEISGTALGHEYKYSGGKKTTTTHTLSCTRCSSTKNEKHNLNGEVCVTCGYKGNHVFEYSGGEVNAKTHLLNCKNCSATRAEAHNFDKNKICKVCSYKVECAHEYIYSSIDETKHTIKCKKCDLAIEENHEFGSDNRCIKCTFIKKCSKDNINAGHPIFKVECISIDENTHEITERCMACNSSFTHVENHIFSSNGKCFDCGFEKNEEKKCSATEILDGHSPRPTLHQVRYDETCHKVYYYCEICKRGFFKLEAHTLNNGKCSCGYQEGTYICEHDSENYKTTYNNSSDSNKHIKSIECQKCNAKLEIRENHEFTKANKCDRCDSDFSMQVKYDTSSLLPGESTQITVTHNGNENIKIKYTSSNEKLISVDNAGNAEAKVIENSKTKDATVKITVKAYINETKNIATQTIDIKYNPKYSLKVDIPDEIYLDEETILGAIATPNNGNGFIRWNISGVGDINQNAGVNNIAYTPSILGKHTLRVSYYNKTGTRLAMETREIVVKERKTKEPSSQMSIFLDEEVTLSGVENLQVISGKSLIVSENKIIGVELGTTIIKDEKENIYVVNVTNQIIPITEMNIEINTKNDVIFAGQKVQAIITTKPENATEEYEISSSDKETLTVTNNGVIEAKKAGKAEITLKTSSGNTVTKEVNVKAETLKLTTNNSTVKLDIGEKTYKFPIDETLLSEETLKNIEYISNNENVATIQNDGTVVLKGIGYAKITAKMKSLKGTTTSVSLTLKVQNYSQKKTGKTKYDQKVGTNEESEKVYVYFGGSGSITGGIEATANQTLKNNTYADTLLVPTGTGDVGRWNEWYQTIDDISELLQSDEYKDKEIVLIGYSSGGYPAAEIALNLAEAGMTSQIELHIVDGVQGSDGKEPIQEYEAIENAGIETTIYASSDGRGISKVTREVGEKYADSEHITYVSDYTKNNTTHRDINSLAHDLIGQ